MGKLDNLTAALRLAWLAAGRGLSWAVSVIADHLRAAPLLILCLPLIWVVLQQAPVKEGVLVYGIAKLFAFAYAGYWLDRLAYRRSDRPHAQACGEDRRAAWYRRAAIIAACIVVSGLTP